MPRENKMGDFWAIVSDCTEFCIEPSEREQRKYDKVWVSGTAKDVLKRSNFHSFEKKFEQLLDTEAWKNLEWTYQILPIYKIRFIAAKALCLNAKITTCKQVYALETLKL